MDNGITRKQALRLIWHLAWPTVLEQLLQTSVSYVDSAMVGRLGANATAAVGATATVNWLILSSVSALGIGFLSYISREMGARRYDNARKAASQVVLAVLVTGVFFTALTLSVSKRIPVWMKADAAIHADVSRYFTIIYAPMLFRCAISLFAISLRAAGDTKTPMLVNTGMNLVNVFLNFLLIYPTRAVSLFGIAVTLPGAGLGVAGAALGSAAAFVFGGVLMTRALWRHPVLSPRGIRLKPDRAVLGPCLRVAVPAALQRFGTSLGYVVFSAMINSLGAISTAAHSIANTAESAFYIPGYGMQAAASTLAGNAWGEGNREKMKRVTHMLIGIEVAVMCLSGAALFLCARPMMRLFTRDENVIRLGATVLRMVALSEPVYGVAVILEGIFGGVGDTKHTFYFNLIGMWGVRIAGTYIAVVRLNMGLTAAWGCMIAHNLLLGALLTARYVRGGWNPLRRAADNKRE